MVSASDTTAPGYTHNLSGRVDYVPAEPLTGPEIERIIESWARAARNAVDAGMDGVQIHGANGYLIHQFLAFNTNMRDDEWGGDPHRRARLAVEVTRAVAAEIGGQRTSIRLSPEHNIQASRKPTPPTSRPPTSTSPGKSPRWGWVSSTSSTATPATNWCRGSAAPSAPRWW